MLSWLNSAMEEEVNNNNKDTAYLFWLEPALYDNNEILITFQ
jgi:hypothetical protein